MEKEQKIDWSQLTPEAAYKRIIEFADKLAKNYSPYFYHQMSTVKFSWDPKATYTYEGQTMFKINVFRRDSDGVLVYLSKYAFLPQDQPIEI